MLNHNNIPSHLASYIIIGVLVAGIMFLCLKIGHYEGDIRTLNIQRNWTEGENKTLREQQKQYAEALQYYQGLMRNARQLTQGSTVNLPAGTIIIPPADQPNPSS